MKIIDYAELSDQSHYFDAIERVLTGGGVACLPCNGTYRLLADVTDDEAVLALLQAKRRISKAPSLVFISDQTMLGQVADSVPANARRVMREMWPGPLTIRFEANPDLPRRVQKTLVKATGKVGVRVPDDELTRRVVDAVGRPLFASSANKENKHGATSPAQIRKTFFGRIGLFVDAGDLSGGPSSTVIDVDEDGLQVVRAGEVAEERLAEIVQ